MYKCVHIFRINEHIHTYTHTHTDGVQLLCLIDKGLDGCRYLQTYGDWETAAWLAKATLGEKDCAEVFSKWADHLSSVSVNQKVSLSPSVSP